MNEVPDGGEWRRETLPDGTETDSYWLPGAEDPPESALLLGPLVRRGERTIVVADTGHGKSTFGLQAGAAILSGGEMLGYSGAGVGPLLWVDLEQGARSIKRALCEAGLADRDDVIVVSVPDGLALDSNDEHLGELRRLILKHRPAVVLLDPYYKAHRADDPNAERPIIDLMRRLDALRAEHGFALILTAHPRKDAPGRDGPRRLTLHDVAGSGAVTRGAEVVLAIERLSHGYARLRILKDRDGDLQVGDALDLVFDRERGFRTNPKEEIAEEAIEQRIREDAAKGALRTSAEWATALGIRKERAKETLEALAAAGVLSVVVGPPGRSPRARCYGAGPTPWDPFLVREVPARRVVLAHLNIEVPEGDTRTADEIADAVLAAFHVGSDNDSVRNLTVVCPLADEV